MTGQGSEPAAEGQVDFFISYAQVDDEHAQWIAWVLEEAGYTTVIQAWDFVAGSHFVHEMHRAAQNAARTVAVLSVAYLGSAYAEAEWQAAWVDDPLGEQRKLLVVRVEDCDRPGLLRQLVSVDIFGLSPREARDQLLKAARGGRRKSASAPTLPRRRHDQALGLEEIADQLAVAVRRQWEDEAAIRRLNEPYPLPVSWEPADPKLVDDWETITRLATTGAGWPAAGSWAAGPAELAGSGRQILDVLDLVPTGRLVVLGEPGSGKTMLATRLVLDLLKSRSTGDPVPVLVSLASWNPAMTGLYDWLDRRLVLDYPGLRERAADGTRRSRARALLDAGMLVLLLDGLDEIAEAARGHAISRINGVLRPGQKLVLLSRSRPYRETTRPAAGPEVMVTGAAGVILCPLRSTDIVDYLQRSAGGPASARRWEPIRVALNAPTPPPVAEALTTPLMVTLARAIYNSPSGEHGDALPDPNRLLDPNQFSSRNAVEQHLFDGFIPAAYRKHERARRCPWSAVDAERWLVFLARHLDHTLHGSPDLAWWQLPEAVSRRRRLIVSVTVFGPVLAAVLSLAEEDRSPRRAVRWHFPRGSSLGLGLLGGLAGWPASVLANVILGLGLVKAPANGLVFGLVFGLVGVLAGAFLGGLSTMPADLAEAAGPMWVLRQDRTAFRSVGLAGTFAGILTGILAGMFMGVLAIGLSAGLALGLLAGFVVAMVETPWGMFVLTRTWLAARGRLPQDLMAFLADAHEKRGVLRQVGAVYQFRHIELQRRLANR